ncbi:ABC transporter substrate-binding protein [Photobacterium profundum]|uniref:Hypothetical ABC transporter, periplasmic solute-binding protein, family 5 n=1 Tax=Photobacterium profundum (strain SS9) TaxID=298386 RepID=Q6LPY9_PHOPR|nr:ABC transporter substrate-binding protein [Photobacterium profundum]CAG20637.1 hypothetical ABC transporter, periplasmic solute-binding protein, family 5 [Photobacterium profundum SS9]
MVLKRLIYKCLLVTCLFSSFADATTLRTPHQLEWRGQESLDPISSTRFYYPVQMLYNRLVRQDESGAPSPELATKWTSNKTATEWVFDLRENVKFHNGKELTSADVVATINRILDPQRDAPVRAVLSIIQEVTALNDYSVQFKLKKAHSDFPILLMDYRIKILPKNVDQDKSLVGIGTGPFKLENLNVEGTTNLIANSEYWEGKPKLDGIDLIAIADDSARVQALLARQIDWIGWSGVTSQQLPLFQYNSMFKVDSISTGDWRGIIFKNDVEPFTDPRVRKALRIVTDREEMARLVLGEDGGATTCDTPVWKGDQYRMNLECKQDIEGAKKLLAEAGFPDGLDIDLYTSNTDTYFRPLVEIYQRQAAKANIRVHIKMTPSDSYWNDVWMKKPAFTALWGQRPTDQVLNEVYRSTAQWNESAWNNPDFDQLLDEARLTLDFDPRKKLYIDAQKMLWEEGGTLIPFHLRNHRVMMKNVTIPAVDDFSIRWNLVTKE